VSETVEPCGARFFDRSKEDMGRAVRVTTRRRSGPTLTVLDVNGAEPELARALTLLDRGRLRIHCEDAARTCYVFRWASGYNNGADVRIQGVLEAHTGRELEGWIARAASTTPKVSAHRATVVGWNMGRPKRAW
jgi:hypothetical protein